MTMHSCETFNPHCYRCQLNLDEVEVATTTLNNTLVLIDRTTDAVFTSDAGRLVREWEQRKRSRLDPTPTSVRVHERARAER